MLIPYGFPTVWALGQGTDGASAGQDGDPEKTTALKVLSTPSLMAVLTSRGLEVWSAGRDRHCVARWAAPPGEAPIDFCLWPSAPAAAVLCAPDALHLLTWKETWQTVAGSPVPSASVQVRHVARVPARAGATPVILAGGAVGLVQPRGATADPGAAPVALAGDAGAVAVAFVDGSLLAVSWAGRPLGLASAAHWAADAPRDTPSPAAEVAVGGGVAAVRMPGLGVAVCALPSPGIAGVPPPPGDASLLPSPASLPGSLLVTEGRGPCALALAADGDWLAVGMESGTVELFQTRGGTAGADNSDPLPFAWLRPSDLGDPHPGAVTALAWSPCATTLAVGYASAPVALWSRAGHRLASLGPDTAWTPGKRGVLATGARSIAFAAHGAFLAAVGGSPDDSHAVVEVGLARAPSGLHPQPAMGPVAGGRNADAAAAAPGAAGRRHCAAMVYGDGVLLVGVDSPQGSLPSHDRIHAHVMAVPAPEAYLAHWPLRHVACRGDAVAVAGCRGVAVHSLPSSRWHLCGDAHHERSFTTIAIAWADDHLALLTTPPPQPGTPPHAHLVSSDAPSGPITLQVYAHGRLSPDTLATWDPPLHRTPIALCAARTYLAVALAPSSDSPLTVEILTLTDSPSPPHLTPQRLASVDIADAPPLPMTTALLLSAPHATGPAPPWLPPAGPGHRLRPSHLAMLSGSQSRTLSVASLRTGRAAPVAVNVNAAWTPGVAALGQRDTRSSWPRPDARAPSAAHASVGSLGSMGSVSSLKLDLHTVREAVAYPHGPGLPRPPHPLSGTAREMASMSDLGRLLDRAAHVHGVPTGVTSPAQARPSLDALFPLSPSRAASTTALLPPWWVVGAGGLHCAHPSALTAVDADAPMTTMAAPPNTMVGAMTSGSGVTSTVGVTSTAGVTPIAMSMATAGVMASPDMVDAASPGDVPVDQDHVTVGLDWQGGAVVTMSTVSTVHRAASVSLYPPRDPLLAPWASPHAHVTPLLPFMLRQLVRQGRLPEAESLALRHASSTDVALSLERLLALALHAWHPATPRHRMQGAGTHSHVRPLPLVTPVHSVARPDDSPPPSPPSPLPPRPGSPPAFSHLPPRDAHAVTAMVTDDDDSGRERGTPSPRHSADAARESPASSPFTPDISRPLSRRSLHRLAMPSLSLSPGTPSGDDDNEWGTARDATGAGPAPTSHLEDVLAILKQFPHFPEVVISVARKCDHSLWPPLFRLAGPPSFLAEEVLARGNLRTAASALVVVGEAEGGDAAASLARLVTEQALHAADYDLCAELLRFALLRGTGAGPPSHPPSPTLRASGGGSAPASPALRRNGHSGDAAKAQGTQPRASQGWWLLSWLMGGDATRGEGGGGGGSNGANANAGAVSSRLSRNSLPRSSGLLDPHATLDAVLSSMAVPEPPPPEGTPAAWLWSLCGEVCQHAVALLDMGMLSQLAAMGRALAPAGASLSTVLGAGGAARWAAAEGAMAERGVAGAQAWGLEASLLAAVAGPDEGEGETPLPPRPLSTKTRAAMAVHALSLCRDEFTADPGDAARSSIDALCDALGCHGAWAWVAALGLVAASKEAIAEVAAKDHALWEHFSRQVRTDVQLAAFWGTVDAAWEEGLGRRA